MNTKIFENKQARPFLRWAGGKSRLVKHLMKLLPPDGYKSYWELFLGSAVLFFAIGPPEAHLSDSNAELISCFEAVRDKPDLVSRYLSQHLENNSEEYYYKIRGIYNRFGPSYAQAARFLYLNRAGFNGIYRVNKDGEYNVPYGHKEPPPAPSLGDIRHASKSLSIAALSVCSYDKIFTDDFPEQNDFVYLDPPYPPLNGTSKFTHYTANRFSWEDQKNVAILANDLKNRGCLVMVSNSDVEKIRVLYQGWNLNRLPVTRWIAANGSRHEVSELVITNYQTSSIWKQSEMGF